MFFLMFEIFSAIFMRIFENSNFYLYLFIIIFLELDIFYCRTVYPFKWIKIHKCLTEKIKRVLSGPKMKKKLQYLFLLQI